MFRRILVPVDFAKKNGRAVRVAAGIAQTRNGAVTLLHVIERVDAGDEKALTAFYRRLEKDAREKMGPLLAAAGRSRRMPRCSTATASTRSCALPPRTGAT